MNSLSNSQAWRLLVVSLPTSAATARMRLWRGVKALGAAALRDGVYLLPDLPGLQDALQALAGDAAGKDGRVWVLSVYATDMEQESSYRALFDRTSDYATWTQELATARAAIGDADEAELLRLARRYARSLEAIRRIDYFPDAASRRADAHWRDFHGAIDRLLSPGEPQGARGSIPRRDPGQYQGRHWATRRHLWVDRVASAWLILRHIDPHATFLWLEDVRDCPADALGFDFDGATFTHIGDRVTFEVLLSSFGLDEDRALSRIGQMVHALDVGGVPAAEASGFEAVLAGARERLSDDTALLDEIGRVLDSLYAHFARPRLR